MSRKEIVIYAADSYKVGEKANLSIEFTPADTSSKEIQWESSNETIACISDDGLLQAISPGEVIYCLPASGHSPKKNYQSVEQCH